MSGEQYSYTAPAVIFEEETGLTGISKQWNLPDGQSFAAFEEALFPALSGIAHESKVEQLKDPSGFYALQHVYDELAVSNPELGSLESMRDNPHQLKNLIMGVSSQLNLDDIIYFNGTTRADREKVEVVSLENAIALRTGTMVRWNPSPKTLKNIFQKMREHSVYQRTFLNPETVTPEMLTTPKGGSEPFWDGTGRSNRENQSRWTVLKTSQATSGPSEALKQVSPSSRKPGFGAAKPGM